MPCWRDIRARRNKRQAFPMGNMSPLIEIAIEPKSRSGYDKLARALAELAAEDSSFHVSTDPGLGRRSSAARPVPASNGHARVGAPRSERVLELDFSRPIMII